MTRRPLVSVSLFAALCGSGIAVAQEAPAADAPAPSTSALVMAPKPIATPTPAPASPLRIRPVSATIAAQLAAVAPKFNPAAAKAAAQDGSAETNPLLAKSADEKPIDAQTDLREIDKPRNTIIRLPSYLVQEERPPTFKERELRTPKERVALGYRKHPGLHLGNLWIFRNDGIAAAMIAEEERLERKKEMEDLASLMSISEQKTVKPMVEQAFMRQPELR